MTASTTRNLLSPTTWQHLWDRLGEAEETLSLTEGHIHDRRITRLEEEIADLRAQAGLPPRTATRSLSVPT